MKTKQLIPILFLVFLGCKKENEKIIEDQVDILPENVFVLKPCPTLVDRIIGLFPEKTNVLPDNALFFSDTIQKKIILNKESAVYISFIFEGASYKNTLGWYSYKNTQPPLNVGEINKHVLFPNISQKGEGGELKTGYTMQLGEEIFPAGTVIGFFLIANGYATDTIDYTKPIHYTNDEFNIGSKQQHILFKEQNCHDIAISFEDKPIDISDNDFNDVIITISDNKEGYETTSFDLNKMIVK